MSGPDQPPRRLARRQRESGPFTTGAGLPMDLVQKSVNRLGWVALIFAIAIVLLQWIDRIFNPAHLSPLPDFGYFDFNVPLAAALGGTVCFLAWSGKLPPMLMLDVGLMFEVLGGLLLALSENAVPGRIDEPFPGPSSVSVWITIFILTVPTTQGKTLLAALATAAMVPVGIGVNLLLLGEPLPPVGYWIVRCFSPFFIAGWAVILSRFIYDLGREVGRERELGAYQLQEVLGKGGMGEVWRAKHRMLAREAAVKLIPALTLETMTQGQIGTLTKRFEREARATAALRSPHTITLYDYGVSEENSFYYVMELLEGLDLWYLVEKHGCLEPRRAVCFLRQACKSLAEAHAAGLVHRDIKPTNLFASRMGLEFDFVKVLDFGLVKLDGDRSETQLTQQGVTTGTPAYLAPESGLDSTKADPRSDIYSLGCVAYWLLTNELVFDEPSSVGTVLAHVNDEPDPPSRKTNMPIPADLEAVIMKCLEKKPEDRPQSAEELDRLLAACEGEPWTAEDARRWWEANLPEYCKLKP
jgi:eukaryotic-like serine/threonine-protein kinase